VSIAFRISATVAGSISDGVPPPKKILVTVRPLYNYHQHLV